MKLTTHLRLEPKLRMRGVIPPFPQYVFMTCLIKQRILFMAWDLIKHGATLPVF